MQVAAAIGIIFAAWAVVGGACLGWGALLRKLLVPAAAGQAGPALCFWAGFSVLIGLLQIWHLFLAVDWRASVVLITGGWVVFFLTRAARTVVPRPATGCLAVLFLIALWLAWRGLDFPRNYDSGLYHFSTVRWSGEYPAVPGLANLHDRLGFNQSYFLFVALLNAHPFTNEGYHAAGSLLWFALAAQLLAGAWPLLRNPIAGTPTALVSALLLPAVLAQARSGDISSPTPDLAVAAAGVAIFLFALAATETAASATVLLLPALIAAAVTLKLSFVVFGLVIAVSLLLAVRRPHAATSRARLCGVLSICGLVWGVPYAIRGIILSGYPAYPAVLFAWPVDWQLPAAEAQAAAKWITSWGRAPGLPYQEVLGSWAWFNPWLQRVLADPEIRVALLATGVALAVLALQAWRPARNAVATQPLWRPLAPIAAALVFWFFAAPDPRFANWLFWLLAAWLLAGAAGRLQPNLSFSLSRLLAVTGVGASFALIVFTGLSPQPIARGLHSSHRLQTRQFVTDSGLAVTVPAEGADPRLWDAPLPTTPYAKASLELRGTSLREGFRTRAAPVP